MTTSHDALLIIAHGSRTPEALEEVEDLARRVAEKCADRLPLVEYAFLNHGQPDVPTGLKECAEKAVHRIYILPWFLNSGVHVTQDIPRLVTSAKSEFPDIEFVILEHIGANKKMPSLISDLIPEDK